MPGSTTLRPCYVFGPWRECAIDEQHQVTLMVRDASNPSERAEKRVAELEAQDNQTVAQRDRAEAMADRLAEEVESVHQALRDAHVYGPESAAQKIAALHKWSIVGENYRIALDDAKHQIDTLRAELNALNGGAS